MDRISELPDVLLLGILSLLPTAKDVVATMVLSKRWQFLWMFVPKLVYDDSYQSPEYGRFSRFVDRSLFMHEAPVVETLHFKLGQICGSGDIHVWIRAADKCRVRELIIEIITYSSSKPPVTLSRSLYTCCRMLVTLKLSSAILVDDFSSLGSFSSLRNLSLESMKYPSDEFVNRFISSCPILQDLVVKRCDNDNVTIFNIVVPSLKSLVLYESCDMFGEAHGFVIDAPSLELLDVFDDSGGVLAITRNMPKIVEAKVAISYDHPGKILASIASVKCLSLCVANPKDAFPVGSIFCCLVHLKMCTCETEWLKLLMHMLQNSPKLRALKLEKFCGPEAVVPCSPWIEPSSVPDCLLLSLETVEWVKYKGTEEQKEVVAFILRSGSCLKKVTINPTSTSKIKKLRMIKELSFLPRRSPTCQLAFSYRFISEGEDMFNKYFVMFWLSIFAKYEERNNVYLLAKQISVLASIITVPV